MKSILNDRIEIFHLGGCFIPTCRKREKRKERKKRKKGKMERSGKKRKMGRRERKGMKRRDQLLDKCINIMDWNILFLRPVIVHVITCSMLVFKLDILISDCS